MSRLGRGRPIEPYSISFGTAPGPASTGTLTGTGGGAGAFTTRKGGLAPITTGGGGGAALAAHKAAVTAIAPSGGGSGTLAGSQGAAPLVVSGGGSARLTDAKGARAASIGTGGGNPPSLAHGKGALTSVTATADGSGVLSGAQTPTSGGIVGTFLMGGGGRLGRSHPIEGVAQVGRVLLAPPNAGNRSGAMSSTGGGAPALADSKGAIGSETVQIPAPPPEMVTYLIVPGVVGTGGGQFQFAYTRSATQVGSVAATGGGGATLTGQKGVAGPVTTTGGGNPALTTRKGTASALATTGGGSLTYSFVIGAAFSGVVSTSGGGSLTATARKGATLALTSTGGGALTRTAGRNAPGTITTDGGGSLTYSFSVVAANNTGQAVGSGGGTVTITAAKNVPAATVVTSAGGTITTAGVKGALERLAATGGGAARLANPRAFTPTQAGYVRPREAVGVATPGEFTEDDDWFLT